MVLSTKEQDYSSLSVEYADLENDSDTSLGSAETLGKHTKRRKRRSRHFNLQCAMTWFRWASVVVLQSIILVLMLRNMKEKGSDGWTETDTETGGDVNGLYIPSQTASHKYTLLLPNESAFVPNMTSNENRMAVRKNWDKLMPLGSGSVSIPDYEQHPMLGKPITDDPIRSGPIFEASWTHALHCLYYTVDTYHQLVVNGTFGFGGERNDDHAAHCFEYLRNQILCMADMTLEGSESVLDATGEGQAHMCRNREEAISWIEARRLDDIQSIVGP